MTHRAFVTAPVIAVVLLAASSAVAEKESKKIEVKAQTARGGGPDENIKSKASNDPNAPAPKPEKTRGLCRVHVDNRTGWYIEIYIDGYDKGVLTPWGDGYAFAIPGPTVLYGVASFTDGSRKTWGPTNVSCEYSFAWVLT